MVHLHLHIVGKVFVFVFNDTATTEIYTLSLHDALPIFAACARGRQIQCPYWTKASSLECARQDRKSTRLNSSHVEISYAVFCLKKKKNTSDLFFPTTYN